MRIWLARISNRGASLSSSPVRAPSMEAAGGAAGCGALGGNVANCRFAQEEQRLARTGGESAAGRRRERRRVVAIMEGGGGGYMYAIVGDILVIRGGAQLGFKRLKKSETRWLFLGCREGNCGDRPFVSPPRYRPPPGTLERSPLTRKARNVDNYQNSEIYPPDRPEGIRLPNECALLPLPAPPGWTAC